MHGSMSIKLHIYYVNYIYFNLHRSNMYKIKENVIMKINISGQERNCAAF